MLRSRKRWIGFAAVVAAGSLVGAGCGSDGNSSSSSSSSSSGGGGSSSLYTIGAPLPMTGDFAAYAKTWHDGAQLAVEQINAAGGVKGHPLKLAVEDTQGDTAKSVSAFTKLATVNKVPVEVSGVSGQIMAMAPVAERTKTVLLNASAQTPDIRGAGDYTFSIINEASPEATDLVKYLKDELHIDKALIYYVDNPTGTGGRDALTAAAKAQGVQIIDTVSHSGTDLNYRTVLAQVKSKNPPAVLVASNWENVGQSLKQAASIGLKTQWLGLSPTISDDAIKTAGKANVEGFHTVRSEYEVQALQSGTPAAKFAADYQTRFHAAPDIYAAHFYDAVYLVKAAIEKGATDGPSMQKVLTEFAGASAFKGVTGTIAFDKDGMVLKPNYIVTIKDGKIVVPDSPSTPTPTTTTSGQ